jgi:hypothetical protein
MSITSLRRFAFGQKNGSEIAPLRASRSISTDWNFARKNALRNSRHAGKSKVGIDWLPWEISGNAVKKYFSQQKM